MNNIIEFFNKRQLIWKDKTFVLAISTGIDSSVLLDRFLQLKKVN